MIEAAGGVVVRSAQPDQVEVLLVHRPHRDDWTLPKGKRRRSESIERCALREVREETGFTCTLGQQLPTTEYLDRKGRPKTVRYWMMTAQSGRFERNREVDEIRWLAIEQVGGLLTYERDLVVVAALPAARPAVV